MMSSYLVTIFATFVSSQRMGMNELKEFLRADPPYNINNYVGPFLQKSSMNNHFDCSILYRNRNSTRNVWPPPLVPPVELMEAYTLGHLIPYRKGKYFAGLVSAVQGSGRENNWSREEIEERMKQSCSCGMYNVDSCHLAIQSTSNVFLNGRVGVVVDSQIPWAEAALLTANASSITTINFIKTKTDHPKLSSLTPFEVTAKYLNGTWEPVDFIWSYSSVQHEGLGRYGDPLNPFGDLEAVAKMYCLLKPGGILYLAVPMGPDAVIWNAHRIYGALRLPLLLRHFHLVNVIGEFPNVRTDPLGSIDRPILLLRKPYRDPASHNQYVFRK